jgi:hypothetical protein
MARKRAKRESGEPAAGGRGRDAGPEPLVADGLRPVVRSSPAQQPA